MQTGNTASMHRCPVWLESLLFALEKLTSPLIDPRTRTVLIKHIDLCLCCLYMQFLVHLWCSCSYSRKFHKIRAVWLSGGMNWKLKAHTSKFFCRSFLIATFVSPSVGGAILCRNKHHLLVHFGLLIGIWDVFFCVLTGLLYSLTSSLTHSLTALLTHKRGSGGGR